MDDGALILRPAVHGADVPLDEREPQAAGPRDRLRSGAKLGERGQLKPADGVAPVPTIREEPPVDDGQPGLRFSVAALGKARDAFEPVHVSLDENEGMRSVLPISVGVRMSPAHKPRHAPEGVR